MGEHKKKFTQGQTTENNNSCKNLCNSTVGLTNYIPNWGVTIACAHANVEQYCSLEEVLSSTLFFVYVAGTNKYIQAT